jgi:hypothetical protein
MKRQNQAGLTLLGFLLVLVVVLFFVYVGMRIAPLYLEYNALVSAMENLEETPGAAELSPISIKKRIENSLWVSYSTENIRREHMRITRSNGVKVRVAYEVRRPMIGNVDVILSFDHSVTLR